MGWNSARNSTISVWLRSDLAENLFVAVDAAKKITVVFFFAFYIFVFASVLVRPHRFISLIHAAKEATVS